MKSNGLILAGLGCLAILAGCGKSEAPAAAPSTAASDASAVVSVDLTAGDSMKYNLTSIEAKPGQEVHVTLTNIGTMPKAAMAHNFILLQKGTDPKAFVDAAVSAAATDYFPPSMMDKIIAHTKLLGPKQSDEITFKAPTEPGDYTFLCSFPAHYLAGMKGTLTVK
jgi:azurin